MQRKKSGSALRWRYDLCLFFPLQHYFWHLFFTSVCCLYKAKLVAFPSLLTALSSKLLIQTSQWKMFKAKHNFNFYFKYKATCSVWHNELCTWTCSEFRCNVSEKIFYIYQTWKYNHSNKIRKCFHPLPLNLLTYYFNHLKMQLRKP